VRFRSYLQRCSLTRASSKAVQAETVNILCFEIIVDISVKVDDLRVGFQNGDLLNRGECADHLRV